MTNREILERIIGDLNELIDKRGNWPLIPLLVRIKEVHEEVADMERVLAAANYLTLYEDYEEPS